MKRVQLVVNSRMIVPLVLGTVYFATLLPGVGFNGDSAKFQFIGKILGVPHEPGYPIYTLLNHIWVSFLPISSVAWRANALSAVLAIATCMLFYATVRPQVGHLSATAGALLLGFSKQFWINSVVAEVYTLATLFLALITYFIWRYLQDNQPKWALLSLATWGLSLGHHPLIAPTIVGILGAIYLKNGPHPRTKHLLFTMAAGAFVGLGSYIYLILRSRDPNALFVEAEAHSAVGLFSVIAGGKFQSQMFTYNALDIIHRLPRLATDLLENAGPAFLFLPWGIFRLDRAKIVYLGSIIVLNIGVYLNYDIPDIEVYVIPSVFACCVLAAYGIESFRMTFDRRGHSSTAMGLILLVPFILLVANFGIANQRDNRAEAQRYCHALETVPDGSVIWEPWYPGRMYMLYYLLVEEPSRVHSVFVSGAPRIDDILDYIENGGSLPSSVRSVTIPENRPVYVISRFGIDPLRKHGYEVTDGSARRILDRKP